MVCPEYSPDDAKQWLAAGHIPELTPAKRLFFVDLDSGHWPMFSKPGLLAGVLTVIANQTSDDEDDPWEPPIAGTEAEHLYGMLNRLRATFRWKADGLDDDQLRQRVGASALSIGALLKHLASCEDDIFHSRIAGETPARRIRHDDQFVLTGDDTAERLYADYDDAVCRSVERQNTLVERLDEPGHLTFGDLRPSIRRHICDLIEEYGRHTGHADLIREAIDGRVGEDVPRGWRPSA